MKVRTLASYGGQKVDLEPVEVPEGELAAAERNRHAEDGVHASRVLRKCMVEFTATTTAAPTTVVPSKWKTQWGLSDTYKPTINKLANGLYEIVFSASYADGLSGGEQETETLAFDEAYPVAWTTDETEDVSARPYLISANTVRVVLREGATVKDQTTGGNDIKCTVAIG